MSQDCDGDVKMTVNLDESVLSSKKRLYDSYKIEPSHQRFYFAGKLMKDKERLRAYKLKKNVVIQVVVRENTEIAQTKRLNWHNLISIFLSLSTKYWLSIAKTNLINLCFWNCNI